MRVRWWMWLLPATTCAAGVVVTAWRDQYVALALFLVLMHIYAWLSGFLFGHGDERAHL